MFFPISAVIGPEELERMEREEEERRNGGTAERRLERQGHGTSFLKNVGWDGWIVDCYVRSTSPPFISHDSIPFGIGRTPDLGDLGSPWIISHVSYLACDPPSAMLLECRMLTVSSSEGQPWSIHSQVVFRPLNHQNISMKGVPPPSK